MLSTFVFALQELQKGMKILLALVALLAFTSCNTMIGLGRDTKVGYHWTKEKIQNRNGGGGGGDTTYDQGAPVY